MPDEASQTIMDLIPSKPRCSRCNRRMSKESERNRDLWNVTVSGGVVVGFLCPCCQTDEESVEAVIHESTLEYAVLDDGRLAARAQETR